MLEIAEFQHKVLLQKPDCDIYSYLKPYRCQIWPGFRQGTVAESGLQHLFIFKPFRCQKWPGFSTKVLWQKPECDIYSYLKSFRCSKWPGFSTKVPLQKPDCDIYSYLKPFRCQKLPSFSTRYLMQGTVTYVVAHSGLCLCPTIIVIK